MAEHEELVEMRPQVYLDPRPAAFFERYHRYARTRQPGPLYAFIKALSIPYCQALYRLRTEGLEHVPESGPLILAPNHFSMMDHWFVGLRLRRHVRFMAKSQLFKGPLMRWFLSHMGAFPVRRGQHDDEAITTSLTLLRRGEALVMYPEGGRSRSGRIGSRARPGIGRLAYEAGAPVVPVAIYGSERARNWRRAQFPVVIVRYGAPLRVQPEPAPARERQQQLADEVLARVRTLHRQIGESIG